MTMGLSGNNDNKQGLVRVIKPTANAGRNRVDGYFICSVQKIKKIMTIVFFQFLFFSERWEYTLHAVVSFPQSC
jgi:hypothetical protein